MIALTPKLNAFTPCPQLLNSLEIFIGISPSEILTLDLLSDYSIDSHAHHNLINLKVGLAAIAMKPSSEAFLKSVESSKSILLLLELGILGKFLNLLQVIAYSRHILVSISFLES
jgi:hypothetical protein